MATDTTFVAIHLTEPCGVTKLVSTEGKYDRFYHISLFPCEVKDTYAVIVSCGRMDASPQSGVKIKGASFKECIAEINKLETRTIRKGYRLQPSIPFKQWEAWTPATPAKAPVNTTELKFDPKDLFALLGGYHETAHEGDWL